MATSPNYAWAEPDNSSLVKNGAADIRTLGDAIDTSVWNVGFGQAGKNKVINGDFGVWQRGTSFTVASDTYTADRFLVAANGGQTMAFTQQSFTAGTAPVAGYEGRFFYQYAVTAAGSGNTYNQLKTRIEGARTLAGQSVTVSFWAKGSASYNITTVGYQNFGTGGSPSGSVLAWSSGNLAVTTSWQRLSYSFTMPSVSGKTFGTAGNDYVEFYINMPTNQTSTTGIWGVQMEYGAKATPFQTASGGSPQSELAMCQRYYTLWATGNSQPIGMGTYLNTTQVNGTISLPVEMRTVPTISNVTGTDYYKASSGGGGTDTLNSLTLDTCSTRAIRFYNASEALGVSGQGAVLTTNNASAFLAFQAEL